MRQLNEEPSHKHYCLWLGYAAISYSSTPKGESGFGRYYVLRKEKTQEMFGILGDN